VYVASAFALGLLWLLAPDIARVWLGPGHERIAELMRLWAIAFALNLLYAPGVAIARGIGMPRYEIWSYAAALVTNVGLAVWWVPRWGTAGVVMAFLASYGVGLLVFAIPFHRGAGIMELWPWLRHEFLPRLAAGLIAIVLTAIAVAQMAALLPGPGWVHAAVTGLLFAVVLATAFYPLGDTQMVFRSVLGIVSALRGRVTGAPPSSATPHRGTP
jgi:O-antigen/teichoic acid export membrane protein